jgi:hypothetical protein
VDTARPSSHHPTAKAFNLRPRGDATGPAAAWASRGGVARRPVVPTPRRPRPGSTTGPATLPRPVSSASSAACPPSQSSTAPAAATGAILHRAGEGALTLGRTRQGRAGEGLANLGVIVKKFERVARVVCERGVRPWLLSGIWSEEIACSIAACALLGTHARRLPLQGPVRRVPTGGVAPSCPHPRLSRARNS